MIYDENDLRKKFPDAFEASEEFKEKFLELREKIENSNEDSKQELLNQAVELSEKTGITFWYVDRYIQDDREYGWDTTVWRVYIPKKMLEWNNQEYQIIQWACERTFIHGERSGNETGEWISSFSC